MRSGNGSAAAQFDATITPADLVEIILPGKILDQQPVGYLRVRPLKPGTAVLNMGGASLRLDIAPETSPKLIVEPRIVSPLAGAAVWGEIAVTAECFVPDATATGAVLHLPDGTEVFPEPREDTGPGRHFVFLLDTTRLQPGENELKVDILLKDQPPVPAEPVRVQVSVPAIGGLMAGECEDTVDTPRPEKYKGVNPSTGREASASEGAFVKNVSADPVWLTQIEVKEPGEYQVMIVARGDGALGAYPTLMLYVDEQPKAITNGRVADRVWRRTPLGLPVHLEAGQHLLGVRFDNDFYEGKVDRNLYLDRYEVAKVASRNIPATSGGEMMSTMSTNTMAPISPMAPMAANSGQASRTGFKISFTEIFDQKTVGGPVTLRAKCRLDDKSSSQYPAIGLWLNGSRIASERGQSLLFTIDPGSLQSGENTVQLRAQDASGTWVESAPQRLLLEHAVPPAGRAAHYFNMFDSGWDSGMANRREKSDDSRVQDSAAWFSNGEAVLHLPETLVGSHDLTLLARGQWFKALPVAEIALRVNGQDTGMLKTEIKEEWGEIRPGRLELPKGPKDLVVKFINDETDGGKGDRNFWLRWIKLQARPAEINSQKVVIAFKYWPKTRAVGLADAVVADVFAPDGLSTIDLLIDDIPQQLGIDISNGLSLVGLPLLTRSLPPGSHRIKIRATDQDGKKFDSEVKEIRVSPGREMATGGYADAVKLLDRLGFGANPADLAPLLAAGPEKWLAKMLGPDVGQREAVRGAVRTQFSPENPNESLVREVLYQSVIDPNPVRQRFVLWAENHFSTWIEKTGREKKRREHQAFERIGVAPFSDLLLTSATSPAMLVYLDQQRSFAGHLNENYAREVMELHTLGVRSGYTQTDVTSLANLLTGWSMAEQGDLEGTGGDLVGEFRYDPKLNAGAPTAILGLEFPAADPDARFERVQMAFETLASYPSTGGFIACKLLEHYVSDPAPQPLVQDLGRVYASSGGDLRAMLTTMAVSKAFLNAPKRVATPLDFSLRTARAAKVTDSSAISDFLRRSGMGLFDHSTPDGYPQEDDNYVSSNALMQRWRFSQKIEGTLLSLVPKTFRSEKKVTDEQTQRILDLASARLLGTCLSETSNRAAMDLLAAAEPTGDARSRLIVRFLCQTPEAGLR